MILLYKNKLIGDAGEKDVVNKVKYPNCNKQLILLPTSYPLYDVQCSGCSFRAQVKTISSKPKSVVRGAGWQIMDKVLKAGFLPPATIFNFCWIENNTKKQEITFYPFIPKNNLKKYTLSKKAVRANYQMFNYVELNALPYFVVYTNDNIKTKS